MRWALTVKFHFQSVGEKLIPCLYIHVEVTNQGLSGLDKSTKKQVHEKQVAKKKFIKVNEMAA